MAVLVAGGTGALGGAVLRDLTGAGYAVTTTWVSERERSRVEEEMGDSVTLVEADLMDRDSAAAAVAAVDDLEAVVNLVGGFASGTALHETSTDDFMGLIRLNLLPGFHLAAAAMPRLVERGGGAFVGVSSRAGLQPFPKAVGYVTGKGAVIPFIQALDAEYRSAGVRCNAIVPSMIDTPANRESMPDADFGKWVEPADIAKVVRFLVSDDSSPTSGAAIPVYGRA